MTCLAEIFNDLWPILLFRMETLNSLLLWLYHNQTNNNSIWSLVLKITQYIENVVQQKRHTHKHMNFVGFILLTIHLNRDDRSVWNVNVLYVLRMNGKQLQTVYRFHSLLYSVVQHTHDPTESHKSQQFISISRLVSIFVLCVCVCLLKGGGTRLSTFWCYLVTNQRNRNLNCLTFNFISVFLSFRSHPKRSYYKR